MSMIIKATLPYFGGKRTLADRIVAQFGPHKSFWDIFCGSLAPILAKEPCAQETANDLYGDLINLARVLRDEEWGSWLYRQLRRTLVHESLYWVEAKKMKSTREHDVGPDDAAPGPADAQRAYTFFVASWLGRNGVTGTRGWNSNFCVRYTVNGGFQGQRFAGAVDSIPAWRRRLRKVTILRRDAFALLEKIEDARGTVIYADPPYLLDTRNQNHGSSKYIHEFEDIVIWVCKCGVLREQWLARKDALPECAKCRSMTVKRRLSQHERLAELLARFKEARIVLSYYASPRLAELYPGWAQIAMPCVKGMATQGKRGSKKEIAPEVLLVNGEVRGEGELF